MRCLACEIHQLFRVVLRFNRTAVVSGQHADTLAEICETFKRTNIFYERPELTKNGMKGAIYEIIIDVRLPNCQRRTVQNVVKLIQGIVKPETLDEGFIEIHEYRQMVNLVDQPEKQSIVCQRRR